MEKIILSGGCFWCLESVFNNIIGILSVKNGYANGYIDNPTYELVCKGDTGFAEAIEIQFDPQIISFTDILKIFFTIHDPTQLNKQDLDIGLQYRSGIYFIDNIYETLANDFIQLIQNDHVNNIVTEVKILKNFYPAESYHDNYMINNPQNSYCNMVILPKLEQVKIQFKYLLKEMSI